ncbi:hypothetical protein HYW73_00870 [Candidatus Nomurabacteria bacterium]|nr:hypothetical protein [Candidatus Nomurabacteria bacterium]
MGKETLGIEKDRIPLKERNTFQLSLMQLMLGEKPISENDKEWNEKVLKWFDEYAEKVSDIIDNPKNKKTRDSIMKARYKEASDIVVEMLKKGETMEGEKLKIAA